MPSPADEQNKELDPRIRRTRKMLQDALAKLLKEKDFEKISIGDIAEESTLNRATFYDHYPDKFALLSCLVAAQFQELIAERNIRFDGCNGAIKNTAMGVCYYLEKTIRPGTSGDRHASSPMETAIVPVIRRMILEGFQHHPPRPEVSTALVSSMLAWAIYGAAREWAQSDERKPVPEIGETIEQLISPIWSSLS